MSQSYFVRLEITEAKIREAFDEFRGDLKPMQRCFTLKKFNWSAS
jgi:hypothetical protein